MDTVAEKNELTYLFGELADFLAKWLIFGQLEYFSYWYSCFRTVLEKKWDCIEFSLAQKKK